MILTTKQKKLLKKLGHNLHPVVTIADQGLKDTILIETREALRVHELIKIKCIQDDRESRKSMIEALAEQSQATLISTIGHTALLFKRNTEKPKIDFKVLRD